MEKEYLRCPNCEDGKGRIDLMEVAGVKRGFYICLTCNRVWNRYRELYEPISSNWSAYLKKIGVSPSNMKIAKKKRLVIVEEENLGGQFPSEKEYLLCPNCSGGYGMIHRMSIKGLKEKIDACDECDETWEKGTAIQRSSFRLSDYIKKKKGIPLSKVEIIKRNPLLIMEEDQV